MSGAGDDLDDDDTSAAGAAPAAGASDDTSTDDSGASDDDSGDGDQVICTITFNSKTGEFTVIDGDEDDDSDESGSSDDASSSGSDDAGAGAGGEGMSPAAGGVAAAPKGKTTTELGAALKDVADILKEAQSESGGSDEDNFQSGFSGGDVGAAGSSSAS